MTYTLVRNGTVIDGTGAGPVPDAAVLIEDDRIRAAGRLNELPQVAGEVTTIDANGGWILPGLIDTHVHLMSEGHNLTERLAEPFSLMFYRAIEHMRRTLDAGVTTVRDAGGADRGVKEAVERRLIVGPRMQISITVLSTTGGHGDDWVPAGFPVPFMMPYPGSPSSICDGVEEVRKKVREVLRAGAEVIKVCSTGGVLSATDHPEYTQFTPEELAVMVQEGQYHRGIKVMAHAQGAEGIKNAVRAGIHSIEHGIYLDDEAIELMLEHDTFLVPTLIAPVGVIEAFEASGNVPEWGIRKAREVADIHRESIAKAHKAGVKIAMGTDCAVAPHGQNLRELGLMCEIGMSPMEALVATTKTAAECLGWQDRVGTLEAGKLADVVISRVDPLTDISGMANVDNIARVVKGGTVVKSRPTS